MINISVVNVKRVSQFLMKNKAVKHAFNYVIDVLVHIMISVCNANIMKNKIIKCTIIILDLVIVNVLKKTPFLFLILNASKKISI